MRPVPLDERMRRKTDRNGPIPEYRPDLGPCWLWTGAVCADGYGCLDRTIKAHRFAWIMANGPLSKGLYIDHLCRLRHCVNPAHLEPVSNRENILRGLGLPAQNRTKTHCKRGHEFTPENTYRYTNGSRACKACIRAARGRT